MCLPAWSWLKERLVRGNLTPPRLSDGVVLPAYKFFVLNHFASTAKRSSFFKALRLLEYLRVVEAQEYGEAFWCTGWGTVLIDSLWTFYRFKAINYDYLTKG